MFTTTLSYVALRLLGVAPDEPRLVRMRDWIHAHGSPLGAASWGKFTLALLGLYDWRGLHPILPELWLLPYATPFHPGRLWCHCRQVYLPMAWLYGTRSTGRVDALIRALRSELYREPYEQIAWERHRDTIASMDNYRPHSSLMRVANAAMGRFEARVPSRLRRRALDEVYAHLRYEDRVTNDIDIGPVNAVLNTVCHHFQAPGGEDFRRGFATLADYLWDGHDGMKMQGYNSTELWDTVFAVQALWATPFAQEHPEMMRAAHRYIRDNQILEDVPDAEAHYRHASRGGWPFSDRAHGWPITDCTAEGLKCAIGFEREQPDPVSEDLLKDSVSLLLSWQNEDGGWASYERQRGGAWLELLNPAQVFGEIMVDYSFVECTSASMQGLVKARARFPGRFDREIDRSVARGVEFLRAKQRPDGSFEGSWGVCFTYGTWFGVSGLLAAGVSPDDPAVRRACDFLLAHQKPDGSWGEHHTSCSERRYVQHPEGQVVMTSWALLTLVRAGCADREALRRAAEFLVRRQEQDGSWARESMAGVFNRTCMINYDNYRQYFPLWALGEWHARETGRRSTR
jgi:squalene/oxidosqualene cyclase-like protein